MSLPSLEEMKLRKNRNFTDGIDNRKYPHSNARYGAQQERNRDQTNFRDTNYTNNFIWTTTGSTTTF